MAQNWALAGMVAALLLVATTVGQIIKTQPQLGLNPAAVAAFNGRVRSWWIICCMLSVAFLPITPAVTVALFGCLSFWALREFITLSMKKHQTYLHDRKLEEQIKWVVIDCKTMNDCDMTGVEMLEQLVDSLAQQGIALGLTNVHAGVRSHE